MIVELWGAMGASNPPFLPKHKPWKGEGEEEKALQLFEMLIDV